MERHHRDPAGAPVLVEPALDGGAVRLRFLLHLAHGPFFDDRHRARDGVPRLSGAGRAVENQVQRMQRPLLVVFLGRMTAVGEGFQSTQAVFCLSLVPGDVGQRLGHQKFFPRPYAAFVRSGQPLHPADVLVSGARPVEGIVRRDLSVTDHVGAILLDDDHVVPLHFAAELPARQRIVVAAAHRLLQRVPALVLPQVPCLWIVDGRDAFLVPGVPFACLRAGRSDQPEFRGRRVFASASRRAAARPGRGRLIHRDLPEPVVAGRRRRQPRRLLESAAWSIRTARRRRGRPVSVIDAQRPAPREPERPPRYHEGTGRPAAQPESANGATAAEDVRRSAPSDRKGGTG